jgi:hypothetical protein
MKSLLVLSLLPALALALLVPGRAAAGPPDGPSGRMDFDEVAGALRRYHREEDVAKRVVWLEKLAPTRDPRVALLIGEFPPDDIPPTRYIALRRLLVRYYVPRGERLDRWWRDNEADLRRRAMQLPQ